MVTVRERESIKIEGEKRDYDEGGGRQRERGIMY